jgi:dihydrofolate synthase/folylpolyglutamate synthase
MGASGPFATGQDALQYLYSLTDYERMRKPRDAATSIFGLGRMEALLDHLGHPERRLRIVHVAGTKGKGSTAAMAAAILQHAGARVGLYTSPHVESVRERIMVNGEWIPEARIAALLNRLYPYLEASRTSGDKYMPTFFETFTVAAFLHFLDERTDYAVLEVGLGGRLDATNVVLPLVCGITPVSFDHTDKLGDTLAQIAAEKAGILKPRVPVVVAPQEPEALDVIRRRAAEFDCPCLLVGRDVTLSGENDHLAVTTPRRTYDALRVPLAGEHQQVNAAVAIALAEEAAAATDRPLSPDAVRAGLAAVRWRARIETVGQHPTLVVDAAHNVASIRALLDTLETSFTYRRLLFVLGIAADKDVDGILSELAPKASFIVFTRASSPRACAPEELVERWQRLSPIEALACEPPEDALTLARRRAQPDDLLCVTGSFYLAGDILAALGGKQPA